jgi:hypothetical protein
MATATLAAPSSRGGRATAALCAPLVALEVSRQAGLERPCETLVAWAREA